MSDDESVLWRRCDKRDQVRCEEADLKNKKRAEKYEVSRSNTSRTTKKNKNGSERTCGRSEPLNDGCVVSTHKIQNTYYTTSK